MVYKITRSYTFLVKNIVNLAFYCARAPKFFIELFLNQMGKEILLKGQYATPEKLINLGFKFEHNNLEDFLNR